MKRSSNSPWLFVLTLLAAAFWGCEEPEPPASGHEVYLLGHRGTGFTAYSNSTLPENTLPAVKLGLSDLHGVEVDVQMSSSGTVWLFHDAALPACGEDTFHCLPKVTDAELEALNSCLPEELHLVRLEEVLDLMRTNYPDKWISLDVKGYFEEACFPGRNAPVEYQQVIARKIVALTEEYQLVDQVLVETNYWEVLDEVKTLNPAIKTFLLGYDNLQEVTKMAKQKGYSGLSFNFFSPTVTPEAVQQVYEQGLLLQFWTPNDLEALERAVALSPDFIQTDNLAAAKELILAEE